MNAPAFIENPKAQVSCATVASLERKRLRAYIVMMIADIASIVAAFLIAGGIYRGQLPDAQALLEAWLFLPLFLTLAIYQRVYSIRGLTDGVYAAKRAIFAIIVAALLLNFIAFYARFNTSFSRGSFTIGLIFSSVFLASLRIWVAHILRRKWGAVAQNIAIVLAGGPEFNLPYAESIDASTINLSAQPNNPEMLHRLANCLRHQEKVLVCCQPDDREAWSAMLRVTGIHGEIISDAANDAAIIGISHYRDQGMTGLVVSAGPLGLRARIFKRLFDIIVASLALIVTAPLLMLAALAIKMDDGGKILFVQTRVGRGNRQFKMFKLRSMRSTEEDQSGLISVSRTDSRLTRVGAFLRRTSIDELPQLFNILLGDMAVVGPRPHALGSQAGDKFFWEVDRRYWHRHTLKPGITGLAQVRGQRGATEMEGDLSARLKSDLEYIASWSLWRDAVITVQTLTILRNDQAY